jgi:hypothetical protein
MPNRHDHPGFGPGPGRGDERGRRPDSAGASDRREERAIGPAGRGGDAGFRAEDAHLKADLRSFGAHWGRTHLDYGHDQNYRPGYHEGGTRFGFFRGQEYDVEGGPARRQGGSGPNDRDTGVEQFGQPADYAYRPETADREFDPDYLNWRQQQLRKHDRDYADWRREQTRKYDDDYWRFRAERQEDFHQRFQDWRAQREAEATAPMAKIDAPDKA